MTYLAQSLLFQGIFLLGYFWLLRKETFFSYNRWYLLATIVLSLSLPFVEISSFQSELLQQPMLVMLPEVVIGSSMPVGETTSSLAEITQSQILWTVYVIGVLISLLLFLQKLYRILKLLPSGRSTDNIITIPNSDEAFTFMNYIFLGDRISALSRKHIQHHEEVHLREKHSYDLLFLELLKMVFWCNPLIYIYQRELALVHEYTADAVSLQRSGKKTYFKELLNHSFGTSNVSFTNSFLNQSLIKNRIMMLHKTTSAKSALWKYALIVPAILSMLLITSCDSESSDTESVETRLEALYAQYETQESVSQAEFDQFKTASQQIIGDQTTLSKEQMDRYMEILNEVSKKFIRGSASQTENVYESEVVPFAVIERVPVYPGCDATATNADLKKCMSQAISLFIQKEFNADLGSQLGLEGTNRIFVQFKIDRQGNAVDLKARAPHPTLEAEALRVIGKLPQMQPGMQQGQTKAVIYSLPISFKMDA